MYSTWEYYRDDYKGTLSEGDYERLAADAGFAIDRLTLGQAASAPSSMHDRLARCECVMVDATAELNEMDAPGAVSSVNNDGFSVSFKEGAARAQENNLATIARTYLTTPVNLLFRGAVVRNANVW